LYFHFTDINRDISSTTYPKYHFLKYKNKDDITSVGKKILNHPRFTLIEKQFYENVINVPIVEYTNIDDFVFLSIEEVLYKKDELFSKKSEAISKKIEPVKKK
jgi:hypothetical protein